MTDFSQYGFQTINSPEGFLTARVTAVHKERYELVCTFGMCHGRLKSSIYFNNSTEAFPTVGDFVTISHQPNGDSQIVKTLPRSSFFSRLDPTPGRGEQAVAANFDYVFVMQSLNHDFNENRLERYLTLGWQSGATPVVVLTKADLVEDYSEQLQLARQIAIGADVHVVSAVSGFGIEELAPYLQPGKVIVFLGSSGIGKSSLVNALAGQDIMAVNTIREDDSRGRHTTTHRQMVLLPSGVMMIDTPGMRELGMWDVSQGLGSAFADVEAYLGACRFSDCRHETEPGCAIQAAIADGRLPADRWERYLRLKREARYSDDPVAYLRERQKLAKGISKQVKTFEKKRRY